MLFIPDVSVCRSWRFVLSTLSFLWCHILLVVFFFFFSSRRRHTRSLCDWSSDVCSSDLLGRADSLPLKLSCLAIYLMKPRQTRKLIAASLLIVIAASAALSRPASRGLADRFPLPLGEGWGEGLPTEAGRPLPSCFQDPLPWVEKLKSLGAQPGAHPAPLPKGEGDSAQFNYKFVPPHPRRDPKKAPEPIDIVVA